MEKQYVKIVWNGCDAYIEFDDAKRDPDYRDKIKGESLFTQTEEHHAFEVVEIDSSTVPVDGDGEMICDGIFLTAAGKFYRSEK